MLGHDAARQLGIARLDASTRIWMGSRWFVVVGILRPVELGPEIDSSALIGFPAAAELVGGGQATHDVPPSRICVRADTTRTATVATLLARAANPREPTRSR